MYFRDNPSSYLQVRKGFLGFLTLKEANGSFPLALPVSSYLSILQFTSLVSSAWDLILYFKEPQS